LKVKILSQRYNPLLKRKEVVFEVDHSQEGKTSSRPELRTGLADVLKTKADLVFVEKVQTRTGTMIALGEANAYDTLEQAKTVERDHIFERNVPSEKAEKAEAEKPAPTKEEEPAPKPEEKKKEE
jgi:small subunit ribosomal protein S24e